MMNANRNTRHFNLGFTLIELFVVIAIISILSALLFPVFAGVREKGRQITCMSNERQLGMGIMQYVQDSDDTFPWSYAGESGDIWPTLVAPYINGYDLKSGGGILVCPDSDVDHQSYSTNPQVIGLLGPATNGVNFFQSVVPLSKLDDASDIVMLGDAISSYGFFGQGIAPMEYAYPHPALLKNHTGDSSWSGTWGPPGTNGQNNKQISWRHNVGANFAYCDGHAKYAKFGTLTDTNWDVRCKPGIGCEGHDTAPAPADYPAVASSCSNESVINCQ